MNRTKPTGKAKLGKDDVLTIRRRYREGVTQRELCLVYGVSIGTIGSIVRGETWGWLTDDGVGVGPETPAQAPLIEASDEEIAASFARLQKIIGPQGGTDGGGGEGNGGAA